MLKQLSKPSVLKATLAVAVFAATLVAYLSALAPTITWEHHGADSGELSTAIAVLGVPHPTGYPTYVLLGKAMTFVFPFGELAFRLNLMSALLGSITVLIVYLAVFDLCSCWEATSLHAQRDQAMHPPIAGISSFRNGDLAVVGEAASRATYPTIPMAATLTALALAFSPVLWSQSIITEVYALHAFFAALTVFLLLRYLVTSRGIILPCLALVFALGLGNHMTLGLMLPPTIALLAASRRRIPARTILASVLAFGSGLLIYLYLPWSAARNPPLDWGDPEDWKGFLWQVTGSYYHNFFFSLPISYLPQRIAAWALLLVTQYNVLGFLLGCLGTFLLWSRRRPWVYFALGASTLVSIFALAYNTTDSYLLLIPVFILFSLAIGAGIYRLLARIQEPLSQRLQPIIRSGTSFAFVSILLAIFLPLWSLAFNFQALSLHGNRLALDYAKEAVEAAGDGAVILADTDPHAFALLYYRYVVAPRTTTKVIIVPLLSYEWYRRQVAGQFPELRLPETWRHSAFYLQELVARNLLDQTIYLTDEQPALAASFLVQRQGNLLRLRAY